MTQDPRKTGQERNADVKSLRASILIMKETAMAPLCDTGNIRTRLLRRARGNGEGGSAGSDSVKVWQPVRQTRPLKRPWRPSAD